MHGGTRDEWPAPDLGPFLDPSPPAPGPDLVSTAHAAGQADPASLRDLGLDQLIDELSKGAPDCALASLFCELPGDEDETRRRLTISQALIDDPELRDLLEHACRSMARVRALLPRTTRRGAERLEDRRWLEGLLAYTEALASFEAGFRRATATRPVWQPLLVALDVRRARIAPLLAEGTTLLARCDALEMHLRVQPSLITLSRAPLGPALRDEFAKLFEPILGREVRADAHRHELHWSRLAAQLVEEIATIEPVLDQVRSLRTRSEGFLDPWVLALERQCRLFLGVLAALEARRPAGCAISVPALAAAGRAQRIDGGWVLDLPEGQAKPCSLELPHGRSVAVVTGPNGAGKTTFARMVGQVAYLAARGLPIPAAAASLRFHHSVDSAFSGPEERVHGEGRLGQELNRLVEVLKHPGPRVLITNEIFASTTTTDAIELMRSLVARLGEEDATAVLVTFLDEVATIENALSLVAAGPPDYTVAPGPPQASAEALALAARHRLRRVDVRERIRR